MHTPGTLLRLSNPLAKQLWPLQSMAVMTAMADSEMTAMVDSEMTAMADSEMTAMADSEMTAMVDSECEAGAMGNRHLDGDEVHRGLGGQGFGLQRKILQPRT